jgi:hypothetical protein
MIRKPVASSNIRSIGFENGAMHVEFANGRVYEYTGPKVQEHYDALIAAPSVGKHFAQHVRSCGQTNCTLVSG